MQNSKFSKNNREILTFFVSAVVAAAPAAPAVAVAAAAPAAAGLALAPGKVCLLLVN